MEARPARTVSGSLSVVERYRELVLESSGAKIGFDGWHATICPTRLICVKTIMARAALSGV